MKRLTVTRRTAVNTVVGTMTMAGVIRSSAGDSLPSGRMPLAFDDAGWNRDTLARLEGDIAPGKFIFGVGSGLVHGVRDGDAIKPLFGFEIFSTRRVLRQPDGSYQRLCRELVFYRDLASRQLLDTWENPYSGERVRVVDVANDPFNFVISEYFPDPPSYGGLNTEKPPRRPLRLAWGLDNEDTVTLDSDIHLHYRNALDPERWPRESAGPMNRVSEFFRYFIRREYIEDPSYTHLPHNGVWARITPWLPWMLMGQAPGHIFYMGRFTSVHDLAGVDPAVLARVRERYPLYLVAPEKWTEPSLSSLENYARTQQPAYAAPADNLPAGKD